MDEQRPEKRLIDRLVGAFSSTADLRGFLASLAPKLRWQLPGDGASPWEIANEATAWFLRTGLSLDTVEERLAAHLEATAASGATAARARFAWTADEHRVFGGRADALARVDSFVDGPPGHLLVLAAPGMGKTALLAQVVRRHPNAIHHFFSIERGLRSRSDYLESIFRQLLGSGHIKGARPPSEDALAHSISECLAADQAENPLLLVLDAVDEAEFTPALLRYACGPGVHVLVSAREVADRDWARELLPWDSADAVLSLGPLSTQEATGVLRAAGLSAGLADQVHTLTAGDPFYLRIVVDELAQAPRRAHATLRGLRRLDASGRGIDGLEDYLDRWWRALRGDEEDPALSGALAVLAVAQGPVRRDELVGMAPQRVLGHESVDRVLVRMARFLTGKGRTGVSLNHGRLRAYVEKRLPCLARRARSGVLDWCESWSERGDRDNSYVFDSWLRHLRQEGTRTADPERVYGALGAAFLQAKIRHDRRHVRVIDDIDGVLRDVLVGPLPSAQRADQVLRLVVLDEEVHAHLRRDHDRGRLLQVAWEGDVEAALADALRLADPRSRVLSLLVFAELETSSDASLEGEAASFLQVAREARALIAHHAVTVGNNEMAEVIDWCGSLTRAQLVQLMPVFEELAFQGSVDELRLVAAWVELREGQGDWSTELQETARRVWLAAKEDVGDHVVRNLAPLVGAAQVHPPLREALGALAAATDGHCTIMDTLWSAWKAARQQQGAARDGGADRCWYAEMRAGLGAEHDAPSLSYCDAVRTYGIQDSLRCELVAALEPGHPTAREVAASIRSSVYRGLALAHWAKGRSDDEAVAGARTALEHLTDGPLRREHVPQLGAALASIATVLGPEAVTPLIARWLHRDDPEHHVLRAQAELPLLQDKPEALSRRSRQLWDEVRSLWSFYPSDPDRAWRVHTAAVQAGLADPVRRTEALLASGRERMLKRGARGLGSIVAPLAGSLACLGDTQPVDVDLEPMFDHAEALLRELGEPASHQAGLHGSLQWALPAVLSVRVSRTLRRGADVPRGLADRFVAVMDRSLSRVTTAGRAALPLLQRACAGLLLVADAHATRHRQVGGDRFAMLAADESMGASQRLDLLLTLAAIVRSLGDPDRADELLRALGHRQSERLVRRPFAGRLASPWLLETVPATTRLEWLPALLDAHRAGRAGDARYGHLPGRVEALGQLLVRTRMELLDHEQRVAWAAQLDHWLDEATFHDDDPDHSGL